MMGDMYYHALVDGLKKCEYASVIYTFTDSPARYDQIKFQVRALLRSRRAVRCTIKSARSGSNTVRLQIIDTLNLMNSDGVTRDLTVLNQTSGIQTLTTDLVIFSVSTQNNQTKQYS
jgi:hypothetical protein